jgi:hypothetical protein
LKKLIRKDATKAAINEIANNNLQATNNYRRQNLERRYRKADHSNQEVVASSNSVQAYKSPMATVRLQGHKDNRAKDRRREHKSQIRHSVMAISPKASVPLTSNNVRHDHKVVQEGSNAGRRVAIIKTRQNRNRKISVLHNRKEWFTKPLFSISLFTKRILAPNGSR